MDLRQWDYWLNQGYGQLFPAIAKRILDGIEFGVPVDYQGERTQSRSARNPPIPDDWKVKVNEVITADVASLKKAGPFDRQPFAFFCVSPISAVPKKNSEKLRVVHNLSHPFHGDSVNASVWHEYMPISSFGHAARAVVQLGLGCWLVKLDVEAAYKQVPVRPEDWCLLGFQWESKWYYERVLPFGLRSSCRLWEIYAAALHHFLAKSLSLPFDRIVIHYVDDFLFVVKVKHHAEEFRDAALRLCSMLGIPMAAGKTEGPVNSLTFLGIELDTVKMEARLPVQRKLDLERLCRDWAERPTASVKELQSLVGTLQFACAVVRPGRFYLRRIIAHMTHVKAIAPRRSVQHPLTRAVRADIQWWLDFLPTWNGHSLLYELDWSRADRIELFTDACNTGYGGYYKGSWFAGQWSPSQLAGAHRKQRISMPFLEMHALTYAAVTFGHLWSTKKIIFRCDCMPVVQAITKCSSRRPEIMHLLRLLSATACRYAFDFRCEHIVGETNVIADILSRHDDCPQFRALCSNADLHRTPVVEIDLTPLQLQGQ